MGMKVAKFGGSSLADAAQFKKVREILLSDEDRRIVVPSAPGKRAATDIKVTDLFYQCNRLAASGSDFASAFDTIRARYHGIAQELGLTVDLDGYLDEVSRNIQLGAGADYAASRGEYLNGILLADYLGWDFVDPQQGIFFDEEGRLDSDKTQEKLSALLAGHERAVVPGFYGCDTHGNVKTFSRGGSDITGAIVARAVQADMYENWTDVSGCLMADPRIVRNPETIRYVTYRELRDFPIWARACCMRTRSSRCALRAFRPISATRTIPKSRARSSATRRRITKANTPSRASRATRISLSSTWKRR